MKLYHIYNPNDSNRVYAILSNESPDNVINHNCNGELVPVYDIENDKIIEGASEEEIEDYNSELKSNYSKMISEIQGLQEAIERFAFDGTAIPKEIVQERERLKMEYKASKKSVN
jgi:hypothetical protein